MRLKLIIAASLLACMPALSSCAARSYEPEPVLPVRAKAAQCPAFPMPAADLLKRPAMMDFLPPSIEALPGS